MSVEHICKTVGVAYATFRRWINRVTQGLQPLFQPGYKVRGQICYRELEARIRKLSHGVQRTANSTDIYNWTQGNIPRDEVRSCIKKIRKEAHDSVRNRQMQLTWHTPNMCWAMDATMVMRQKYGQKISLQQIQDTASRYVFKPLAVTGEPSGEQIAQQIEELIAEHGAPLFLKRDNGANQNHHKVDDVLSKYGIIPLNSPPYYPRYNGAIERTQKLLKSELQELLSKTENVPQEQCAIYAE